MAVCHFDKRPSCIGRARLHSQHSVGLFLPVGAYEECLGGGRFAGLSTYRLRR